MTPPATATPEMDAPTTVAPDPSTTSTVTTEPKTLDDVLNEVDDELAAEATTVAGVDRGDGRDATGRWVKQNADGTPAPEPPAEPAPTAAPGTPAPPAGAPETAPLAVSGGTFRYRANGATHEFPGATLDEKGAVLIAPESVGQFRAVLNAAKLAEGEYLPLIEQYKSKVQQLEAQVGQGTAAEAQATALVASLSAALEHPDEIKALEAFYTLRESLPSLTAKAEAAYWRSRASAPSPYKEKEPAAAEAPAPTQPNLPTPEAAHQATTEYLERCKIELPEFRDVTPDDWKQLAGTLQRTPYAFLRTATPEEVQAGAFAQGEVVYDTDQFLAFVQAETAKARQARETAKTQTKLAADNARRTTPQVTAPPSASGTTAPAKAAKQITSKQDADDYWDSDEV
jgi:hypothetical protein